ncbi:hypothetical protein HZC07_02210 [Candidatus Micrarchaeota archaeon]|nr:hypothetical protein [Candidatus Micrarchaeota archaeon]
MAFTDSFYSNWQVIAIAVSAIAVFVSVILIMLSRVFGMRNLEQTAKTEFVYAASTVLIVGMIIAVINAGEPYLASGSQPSLAKTLYLDSFQISQACAGALFNQNTLVDWVLLYLDTPTKCVESFMNKLYVLSIPIEATASIFMEIFMSEHASGFGVKWIAERINNTTSSMTFYMYIYFLLKIVLSFIKYYGGFFFSIGVILRAFPPTRGAGAYVMAVAFGLYFIFPLSYIFVSAASLPHAQSSIVVVQSQNCLAAPTGGNLVGSFSYYCALPPTPSLSSYACRAPGLSGLVDLPDRIKANSDALQDMLTYRLTDFTKHLVSAICIFPFIAFVILMTFVLNVTTLFGGNIPEIGRGLVKLI